MRKVSTQIPVDEYVDDPRAAVTGAVFTMMRNLGPVDTGGLTITIETGPQILAQLETVVLGLDFAGRLPKFTCACGYEPKDVEDIVGHFEAHGATRLEVHPVNRPTRRR